MVRREMQQSHPRIADSGSSPPQSPSDYKRLPRAILQHGFAGPFERKSDVRYEIETLREAIGFGFVLIQFSFELSKVAIIGQLHVPHRRDC
ncbi:MAG: hypothetical protein ACI8P0_000333 [Planctomycetaceae bacterium]